MLVTLARIMPEREAWLHENAAAKASVTRGLLQAKAQEFVDGPDTAAANQLAALIGDQDAVST